MYDLSIQRYAVTPLSHNVGIVGWVPHCDTLHALIRDYRESRKVPLGIEHRLMLHMAPDYESLPLVNKVRAAVVVGSSSSSSSGSSSIVMVYDHD